MVGFGRHSEQEWTCPFCNKGRVIVHFREGYVQSTASSISAGKKYTKHAVDDKIENIGSDCPICGKSSKEIKEAFESGITRVIPHEERLKRLQHSGLPTKIVSKKEN